MRKLLRFIFLLLELSPLSLSATVVNGINYDLDWINYTAEVSHTYDSSVTYNGNVIIPSFVFYSNINFKVNAIGDHAFDARKNMTSITIPTTVTSIGNYAFRSCYGLKSLTIPSSVSSIGNDAFNDCTSLKNLIIEDNKKSLELYTSFSDSPLESVYIGRNLFYSSGYGDSSPFVNIKSLVNITLSDYVTSLGSNIFRGCTGLTSITIPSTATSIFNRAFYGCTGLSSLIIPNSVTSIGDEAFYGCTGLSSLIIPNSVTRIGDGTFYGCSRLSSMTIPNSVTEIGHNALNGCDSLKNLIIEDSEASLRLGFITESAVLGLFTQCPLESVYIGRNLNFYNYSDRPLFANNNTLCKATISNYVTNLCNYLFYGCSGLTSIAIPKSVTSIGEKAFYGCSGLKLITIPNSVTSLGASAFFDCSSLSAVTIGNSILCIDEMVFAGCSSLTSVTIPSQVTSIGYCGFSRCSALNSITIPNSITNIGNFAFFECKNLKEVVFEDGEKPLTLSDNGSVGASTEGMGLFHDCPLESVYLGRNLSYESEKINGYSPFYNQQNLTDVVIGDGVVSIGDFAFAGCKGKDSITLPASLTSIGDKAFAGWELTKVNSFAEVPPALSSSSFSQYAYSYAIVTVPANQLYQYKSNWTEFTHFLSDSTDTSKEYTYNVSTPGELISTIDPDMADQICNLKLTGTLNGSDLLVLNKMVNISSLDLSEASIISGGAPYYEDDYESYYTEDNNLGAYWSYNLNLLATLKLPKDLLVIGEKAFQEKLFISTLTIPASVTNIDNFAFNGCSALKELWIERSTETLVLGYNDYYSSRGKGLFYDCPLESVYIGRNLSYYDGPSGFAPFYNKETLKSITFSDSVTSINESAFYGCTGLTKVSIPDPVWQLLDYTFYGCSNLKEITLPGSMREISGSTFSGCTSLEKVNVINPIPPVIDSSTFADCPSFATLNIPDGSKNIYWIHTIWGKFKKINNLSLDGQFEIENLVYYITSEENATVEVASATLHEASRLANNPLKIPSEIACEEKVYRVTGIANKGFAGDKLTYVYLPETISYVGLEAFKNNDLTEIECMALMPPSANSNSFDVTTYQNGRLTVDKDVLEAYANNEVWGSFVNSGYMIPITSLELDPATFKAEVGYTFQIEAMILPEDATNKLLEWSSSDDSIGTVDQNGFVKVLNEGNCIISARTTDGTDLLAECMVSIETDVDEIRSEPLEISVYDLNGVLISNSTDRIPAGIYLIRQGNSIHKVAVK